MQWQPHLLRVGVQEATEQVSGLQMGPPRESLRVLARSSFPSNPLSCPSPLLYILHPLCF